jgi:biopolymer transport protein ExbD
MILIMLVLLIVVVLIVTATLANDQSTQCLPESSISSMDYHLKNIIIVF